MQRRKPPLESHQQARAWLLRNCLCAVGRWPTLTTRPMERLQLPALTRIQSHFCRSCPGLHHRSATGDFGFVVASWHAGACACVPFEAGAGRGSPGVAPLNGDSRAGSSGLEHVLNLLARLLIADEVVAELQEPPTAYIR